MPSSAKQNTKRQSTIAIIPTPAEMLHWRLNLRLNIFEFGRTFAIFLLAVIYVLRGCLIRLKYILRFAVRFRASHHLDP